MSAGDTFLPLQPKLLNTCVSGSLAPGLAVGLVKVKPAAWASVQAASAKPGNEDAGGA